LSTRFFTNEGENTLLKKFEGVFRHNVDIRFFDALVGFFRASGYFAVRPHLGNVPHIRVFEDGRLTTESTESTEIDRKRSIHW